MSSGLLFYVCWIINMYTCGKKRYRIIKRDKQIIIELTLILNTYLYLLFTIVHNIVIPDYKDISLHIFFLVLFGN